VEHDLQRQEAEDDQPDDRRDGREHEYRVFHGWNAIQPAVAGRQKVLAITIFWDFGL
jgi:hypothetical protein